MNLERTASSLLVASLLLLPGCVTETSGMEAQEVRLIMLGIEENRQQPVELSIQAVPQVTVDNAEGESVTTTALRIQSTLANQDPATSWMFKIESGVFRADTYAGNRVFIDWIMPTFDLPFKFDGSSIDSIIGGLESDYIFFNSLRFDGNQALGEFRFETYRLVNPTVRIEPIQSEGSLPDYPSPIVPDLSQISPSGNFEYFNGERDLMPGMERSGMDAVQRIPEDHPEIGTFDCIAGIGLQPDKGTRIGLALWIQEDELRGETGDVLGINVAKNSEITSFRVRYTEDVLGESGQPLDPRPGRSTTCAPTVPTFPLIDFIRGVQQTYAATYEFPVLYSYRHEAHPLDQVPIYRVVWLPYNPFEEPAIDLPYYLEVDAQTGDRKKIYMAKETLDTAVPSD